MSGQNERIHLPKGDILLYKLTNSNIVETTKTNEKGRLLKIRNVAYI